MPSSSESRPIASKADLVDYLEQGIKTVEARRIGTEHEKFAFTIDDLKPLPYDGERSIEALLEGLQAQGGWEPVLEGEHLIALKGPDHASVTLEPGGQVELSGAPLESIHDTCREVTNHLRHVKAVAEPLGIGLIGLGFHPKEKREDIPWMPKGRYKIMREYMPKVGSLGLDMMVRTSTVQVNLDFTSEADMIDMFRIGLALQPIATALWASSPFTDGKPNGFKSYRSHIWTDTDPARTGILPFVFEEGMGFERYVDYMLDVPMYFVYRDGNYIDAMGQSFRDFMAGKLPALPGEMPTVKDWEDHLTVAFPEVRLKRYLEMRGADGGPWGRLCALPALWTGLLYDDESKAMALDIIRTWTPEEHVRLRAEVPTHGLDTPFRTGTVKDVAIEVLAIVAGGLARRNIPNAKGRDERIFLETLFEIVESGKTLADVMLEQYHGSWGGSVDPVFKEYAY